MLALKQIGRPANIAELYGFIINNNYYNFGAKDPMAVLRVTLDRHCVNKNLSSMHQRRLFRKLVDGKYELSSGAWDKEVMSDSDEVKKAAEVEDSLKEIHVLAEIQRDKVKKEIVASLRNLSSEQFEDFCRIF